MRDLSKFHPDTRLVHSGRKAEGTVNPPVERATTLLLPDAEDLYNTPRQTYALDGLQVQNALHDALMAIEGGAGVSLAPSGLSAVTLALLTVAKAGGEVLVVDSAYKPTRRFAERTLKRLGIDASFYDPRIGAAIADLITERTCAILMESPGSLTFEVQDVPAIAAAARTRSVPTILDNTWSAGLYFKPFAHGVDLSIHALSKYQGGHADAFMGAVISSTPQWAERVRACYKELGLFASPDDTFLVLRGMRTLAVRLERQGASALKIAQWLEQQSWVARVLYPALQSSEDHALWKRDFTGASGLFAVELRPLTPPQLKTALESLQLFAMGFSWGGYESLAVPVHRDVTRTAKPRQGDAPLIRLSIGLEHPDDLIADLKQAFGRNVEGHKS